MGRSDLEPPYNPATWAPAPQQPAERPGPLGPAARVPGPDDLVDRPSGREPGGDTRKVAVALGTGSDGTAAGKVLAKGHGALAERIVEVALASGVEVREDKDLAMILAEIDLDEAIPIEVYEAVARLLTYAYRMNAEARGDAVIVDADLAGRQAETDRPMDTPAETVRTDPPTE